MRTTLDIEDDLLIAAKELARREGTSAGEVVSRLLRQALTAPPAHDPGDEHIAPQAHANGFVPFAARGVVVTHDKVDALRDTEGV